MRLWGALARAAAVQQVSSVPGQHACGALPQPAVVLSTHCGFASVLGLCGRPGGFSFFVRPVLDGLFLELR